MTIRNLEILASFYDNPPTNVGERGDKLSISRDGNFERETGWGGAFSRTFSTLDQSFTNERIQKLINQNFNNVLNTIKNDSEINDALVYNFTVLFKAFKGYRLLVDGYGKNNRSWGSNSKNIYNENKIIDKKIAKKIIKVLLDKKNINIEFEQSQNTFLKEMNSRMTNANVDFVNGGICWGISAKWVQRWITGKEGFGASSKAEIAPLFSDGWDNPRPDDGVRFQKKSVEMFILMHHQNTIGSMGGSIKEVGGFAESLMNVWDSTENKTVEFPSNMGNENFTLRGAASNIYAERQKLSQNKANFRDYVRKKSELYADIYMYPRKYYHLNKKSFAKNLGPKEVVFNIPVVDMFDDILPFELVKGTAHIVSWRGNDGGHAMALAYSQISKNWYFMDPNYGEWRGTFEFIRNVILLLWSQYTSDYDIAMVASQRFYKLPKIP